MSGSEILTRTFLLIPFLYTYDEGMKVSNLFNVRTFNVMILFATDLLYVMMAIMFPPEILISLIELFGSRSVISLATLIGIIILDLAD